MEHAWHKSMEIFEKRGAQVTIEPAVIREVLGIKSIGDLRLIAEEMDNWLRSIGAIGPRTFLRWIRYDVHCQYVVMGWIGEQFLAYHESEYVPDYALKQDEKTGKWELIPEPR